MFEKSFLRPVNFFQLSEKEQWEIDEELGILDWEGRDLTEKDKIRFFNHYETKRKYTKVTTRADLILKIQSMGRAVRKDPKTGIPVEVKE